MSGPRAVRVIHIGAGRFSRLAHGPALQRLAGGPTPAVRLEAVCDLDPSRPERARRFQQDFGYSRWFDDVDRMIDETAPGLIVCSVPPRRSGALLRTILPRGIPTFTEKPPAGSAREAAELAELAARSRAVTYVAFNRRRMPAIELAKQWIQHHDTLCRVRAIMERVDRREPDFLTTTGIHAIDTLRYLAGALGGVAATRTPTAHGCGANYTAALRFESGVVGNLRIRVDAAIAVERYLLECASSTVDVCVGAPYSHGPLWAGVRVWRGEEIVREMAAEPDWLSAAGIIHEHRACLQAVTGQARTDCSLEDACRSMALAERIARDAEEGEGGAG